ncbi:hypothetical protein CUT44_05090 [Streptomyces carminius]|uniref:Uncharacterized protein n=1 Tax=Streptomyces carminius TaxID=2665496 RepID=A0A2M8M552_9ACTN|nr:hypothetical protein CUT44_05090 [Streptomyces carminius]
MTFGTLLSSQGTDASFGTSPEAPPGASLRCFRLYQPSREVRNSLPTARRSTGKRNRTGYGRRFGWTRL